jgi:hypothetical protein
MRQLLLSTVALLGIGMGAAQADNFTYTGFSVNPGVAVTLTDPTLLNTPFQASVGEITLSGTGTFMGTPITSIAAWCVDILTGLNPTGTYNIVPFPGPGSVGNGNPSISALQVSEIASLIDHFGGALDNNPGVTQLAIWRLEYGPGLTFSSTSSAGVADIAASVTLAAEASSGGALFDPAATLALLDVVPTDQILAVGVPTVPLPAALPLFAGGLAIFYGLGRRRRTNRLGDALA